MITVKEAIKAAMEFVAETFGEGVSVEFASREIEPSADDTCWYITVSLVRGVGAGAMGAALGVDSKARDYKTVTVYAQTGAVKKVINQATCMNEYVHSLLPRYRSCGLLIDTNILLLYFVRLFDRSWVERFKRTRGRYSAQDFDSLTDIVLKFDRIVTTPNVLSELSNLSNQWAEPAKTRYFERFAQKIYPACPRIRG